MRTNAPETTDRLCSIDDADRVLQRQRLELVGQMSVGIAHDLNNTFQLILGYANLVSEALDAGTSLHDDLQKIIEAGAVAVELVQRLLSFSAPAGETRVPMDVGEVVLEAARLLQGATEETIKIRTHVALCGCPLVADPIQIRQVVMNLMVNACQAMGDQGGVLNASSECVEFRRCTPADVRGIGTERVCRIRIEDSGCGMEEKDLAHLFDPHYSTKQNGNGLGLAIVADIVRKHNGVIRVDSEPGRGTVVEVELPAAENGSEAGV